MRIRLLPEDTPLGWAPYAWLVYLGSLFFQPAFRGASATEWAIVVAIAVGFLPIYFLGYWVRGWRLLLVCGVIAAIGLAYAPWNPGACTFFIYAAAFLGEVGPPVVGFRWMAVLMGLIGLEAWWLSLPAWTWAPGMILGVLIGGTNIQFAEQRRGGARLRALEQESARAAERDRIARDLHDLLGHTLSVIVLKSELASKLAETEPGRAAEEIRDVERISRDALTEVRQAVSGYRSEGFQAELTRAESALAAAGVRLESQVEPVNLAPDLERALTFALREAVTNVVRHARARRCWVKLDEREWQVVLEIRDDGIGGHAPEGSGISGMRARVAALAGTLEREVRGGTRVRIMLPGPSAALPTESS